MELKDIEVPEKLLWRPRTTTGVPAPYAASLRDDGTIDWATPSQEKWFTCVKENRCAYCGLPNEYWIYFLVVEEQLQTYRGHHFFTDPPMHETCAWYMWEVIKEVVKSDKNFWHLKDWAMYITRKYRLAQLTPPASRPMDQPLLRIRPHPARTLHRLQVSWTSEKQSQENGTDSETG